MVSIQDQSNLNSTNLKKNTDSINRVELWLNEGFATWVGWLAIDHFHPDHEVWSQFVAEAVQTSQNLDSLRSSHPIEVPVKDALEVVSILRHH